jgi:hypothetical protein
MPSRTQVTLDQDLDRRAKSRARSLGISFAEYVRRLIAADLGDDRSKQARISDLFGSGSSGGSHVARDKDRYLGEALTIDHRQ